MRYLLASQSGQAVPSRKEILDAIQRGFQDTPGDQSLWGLMIAAVAFVAVLVAARLMMRRSEAAPKRQRPDYLTVAVDLLGLSEAERKDLSFVAQMARMEEPAAVLLSPGCLGHAVAASLERRRDEELRGRMEELSQRLFGVGLQLPAAGGTEPRP